jgi:hypothetical protein
MVQQWLTDAAREAFRERDDAIAEADRAADARRWLESLPLDGGTIAALVEPLAALEAGLRAAGRGAERPVNGSDRP